MNIGIDIDDTLTDIRDELKLAAEKYANKLGKEIKDSKYIEDQNNGNIYQIKYGFTYEELKYFLSVIQEEITKKAEPREGCVEVINKLHNKGHKIYIITARDSEFHKDPYELSKNWLDKNNIYYDKLIVNARSKAPVCKTEKIDIFIDDQLNNCVDVSKAGIRAIRISNDDNSSYENIETLLNWNKIYNYINEME